MIPQDLHRLKLLAPVLIEDEFEALARLESKDGERLMAQLHSLVDAGNTVMVVEHDMEVIGASDWVADIGPGAGDEGGKLVAQGTPAAIANAATSRTAPYLKRFIEQQLGA